MLGCLLWACALGSAAALHGFSKVAGQLATAGDDFCTTSYDLDMNADRLTYSNLGFQGPDLGRPRGMLMSGIFKQPDLNLDMYITVVGNYYPTDPGQNQVNGEFVGINVPAGNTVNVKISFIDPRTNSNVKIPSLTLTVAGMGKTENGGNKEFYVEGLYDFKLAPHSSVKQFDMGPAHIFQGSTVSDDDAGPLFSKDLDDAAMKQAVALHFKDVGTVDLSLAVTQGLTSRTFYIGGASNVVCPQQARCHTATCPRFYALIEKANETYCAGSSCTDDDVNTCCEPTVPELCKTEYLLMFPARSVAHSNLGGLGPDFDKPANLRFANVFPGSGSTVDLVISNRSEYTAADPSSNGLKGDRARISLAAGTSVDLDFMYVDKSNNGFSFIEQGFHFTLYDLDQEVAPDGSAAGIEKVTASNFTGYVLSNTTTLKTATDSDSGRHVFSATTHTAEMDPHKGALNMTKRDLSKAVSFEYPSTAHTFSMTFGVSHGLHAHEFLFTGFSTLPCPAQATCQKYECPSNMKHRSGREEILCASSLCSDIDESTCCMLSGPSATPALCDTFACPGNSRLKPSAHELTCMGEECGSQDAETCCMDQEKDACSPAMQLVLNKLAYNNLAGGGPDVDSPHGIRFQDVFPGSGQKIDLDVVAAPNFKPKSTKTNGMVGSLAAINVPVGTNAALTFTFVKHGTNTQVQKLWPYILTIIKMQPGQDKNARQGVAFPDSIIKSVLTDFTKVSQDTMLGMNIFSATDGGTRRGGQNATALHPFALTEDTEDFSVAVMMDKTQFPMKMDVSGITSQSGDHPTGRTFLFAGASSMICPQLSLCSAFQCPAGFAHKTSAPWTVCPGEVCTDDDLHTCCDCDDAVGLRFNTHSLASSSFGTGLSGSLILEDVFPRSGDKVNLQVSTIGEYYSVNGSATGLNGEFLSLNLRSGAEAKLMFNFTKASGEPYIARSFFFSAFDLDEQGDGGGQEGVRVSNVISHKLTEPSAVSYNDDLNAFVGNSFGTASDNPSNALALTPHHLAHSITFLMEDNITSFSVTTRVSGGWSGRNILFGGASNVVCPERALCIKAKCPKGMTLHKDSDRMVCKHKVCLDEDIPTCCVKK